MTENEVTLEEATEHSIEVAKEKYLEGMLCHANPDDGELDNCIECAKEHEQLAHWLEEIQQYHQIGTVSECQRAMEKQRAEKVLRKQPVGKYEIGECPCCNMPETSHAGYCGLCGQKLDWGGDNE